MAIKYNSKQVKVVKFDNNDVKKIIKDGTTVWEKPYTLTENSFDGSLVTYTWKSTSEPSAKIGNTITKTQVKEGKHTAAIYNEDTVTVTYNTDSSKGAFVDLLKIDGTVKSTGGEFSVSNDVEVDVIAVGQPATLQVTLDSGINSVWVKYIDIDGQQKSVQFEDSASHTISDIWAGTTVKYYISCKAGHTVTSSSPAAKTWHSLVATSTHSINVASVTQPVTLTAYFDTNYISSVSVDYVDNDTNETKTVNVTTSGYRITNAKYASSYYYKATIKSGTTVRIPFPEDYGVLSWNNNYFSIDIDYEPCIIEIDWSLLAPEIEWVEVQYLHAEYNGVRNSWIRRNSSLSNIENARKGTTAQLISFEYSKAGCYVDSQNENTRLELTNTTNTFKQITVELLDLDDREPITFTVPSYYDTVEVTYINITGKEVTVILKGGDTITDAAEGSWFHFKATIVSTSGSSGTSSKPVGTTVSGTIHPGYDFATGTASPNSTQITIPAPDITPAKVYIAKADQIYRNVQVTINDNIDHITVWYHDVDETDDSLVYAVKRCESNTEFRALVGHMVDWHAWGTQGCMGNPEDGYCILAESGSNRPYIIDPTAKLTYGVIRPIFGKNIATITVEYYYAPGLTKTVTLHPTDSGIDITDALLTTRFTWTATAVDGYYLERSAGSGTVSKWYKESLISPEVDTEPYKIYFDGDYVDWRAGRYDAGPGDILELHTDESTGVSVKCLGNSGTYRWDNNGDPYNDTVKYTYSGTISLDKTFPITMSSSVVDEDNCLYITANGISRTLKTYTVARSTPANALGAYVSSDASATTAAPADYAYSYGTTVYLFAVYPIKYYNYYTAPSGWTYITHNSDNVTYRVASANVNENSPNTSPFTVSGSFTAKNYDVALTGDYVTWKPTPTPSGSYLQCCYGDTFTASTNTVICKTSSGTERWRVVANKLADTAQYTYKGAPIATVSSTTFTGTAITITATGVSRVTNSYTVTLNPASLTGCNEVFLATSNTAVSGTHTSGTFDYGTTVYAIAAVNSSSLGSYELPSSWGTPKNSSGGYYFYQAGSVYVDGNETISLTAPTAKTTFTITLDGTGIVWKQGTTVKTSMTAYKNDVITRVSSTDVACSYMGANGSLAERWRITVSRAPDTTTTTYSGTPSIPTFSSWTVTSDKKLSALFTVSGVSSATRKYTVTWKTQDGTSTYETDSVAYNTGPDYNGETPGKTATAQYNYKFAGWATSTNQESGTTDTSLPKVTGNVTYYAAFSKEVRKYTVTWKNWDGTVLETDLNVTYGTTPTYNGSTPTRSSSIQYSYNFLGWNTTSTATTTLATFPAVTGDVTYYAIYQGSLRSYVVNWYNHDGSTLLQSDPLVQVKSTVNYRGSTPTRTNTAQYTYRYVGWSIDKNSSTASIVGNTSGQIMGDTNYYAAWESTVNQYTVSITKPTYDVTVHKAVVSTTYTPSNGAVGTATSTTQNYGTTVYGFIVVDRAFSSYYTVPSTWTLIHYDDSQEVYRVGSVTITGDASISYSAPTRKTGTVSITKASYMDMVYLNVTSGSMYGNASGTTYNVGNLVYGFTRLNYTNYNSYNTPSSWTYLGTSNGYYYYQIGRCTVQEGSNTITYTAATAKPTLAEPSVSIVSFDGSSATVQIHNGGSITCNITVDLYDADTDAYIGSKTYNSIGSYKTESVVFTGISSSHTSIYAEAYAEASGYIMSSTATSVTCSLPKLTEPSIVGTNTEVVTDTNVGYNRLMNVNVKNLNSVAVEIYVADSSTGSGWSKGTASENGGGLQFTIADNAGTTYYIYCKASGYADSNRVSVTISGGTSGGGGDTTA